MMFVSILIVATLAVSTSADFINGEFSRTVDLNSPLVRVDDTIVIRPSGSSSAKYDFAVEPSFVSHLAYIAFQTVETANKPGQELSYKRVEASSSSEPTKFRVDLPKSLSSGQELKLRVEAVFTHMLEPYPRFIGQADRQSFRFFANRFCYSPYATDSCSVKLSLPTSVVHSYSDVAPVQKADRSLMYGPHKNLPALSYDGVNVHFENNGPFLAVTKLNRLIEVSHWGNVAVEEQVELRHIGAILRGSFSRFDFQRQPEPLSAVQSFRTLLPAAAKDAYYRDVIGNISTSHLRELDDAVELEIRPRFPLFGGWKTVYTLGYNVPAFEYLFNSGSRYQLKMRLVDHIFDDQVLDDVELRIVLPEWSYDVELATPYPVDRQPDSKHYTYLDTVGRPVVVIKMSNLVENHILDFELSYSFSKWRMILEPLYMVVFFYIFFLTTIVYVRLDFAISHDQISESKMRIASFMESVRSLHDRHLCVYSSYDELSSTFRKTKDQAMLQSKRKQIDTTCREINDQIKALLAKVKAEGTGSAEAADKITQLQAIDSQIRESLTQMLQIAEKLVNGRCSRQHFVDAQAAAEKKRSELLVKADSLLSGY